METTAMFAQASRLKVRFNTTAGALSTEDLWDLPLSSSTNKPNLDAIAQGLYKELKNSEDVVSFVNKTKKADTATQLKFDIVKHVIDVRLAENEAASTARERKEKKQQILAIIAQKENEKLANTDIEELRKLAEQM